MTLIETQMTADILRDFKHTVPFEPFTIHTTSGAKFLIDDPESLVLPRDWSVNAIVALPRGRFSFLYLKNISHVESKGNMLKIKGRRKRGKGSDES